MTKYNLYGTEALKTAVCEHIDVMERTKNGCPESNPNDDLCIVDDEFFVEEINFKGDIKKVYERPEQEAIEQ